MSAAHSIMELRDAGAKHRPAVLHSLNARVAAGDLKRDRAGGEGLLDLGNPRANHSIQQQSGAGLLCALP